MADDAFYTHSGEPVNNLTISLTALNSHHMNMDDQQHDRPPGFSNLSEAFVPVLNASDHVVWEEQRGVLMQRLLYGTAFALISIVCTIGNCTVIWIVLSHRKMRTVTNFAIAHLALADLMLGSWNPMLVCQFLVTQHWQYGSALCVASNFIAHHSIALSVFTLISISFDRYMAIMRPLKSQPRSQKRLLTTLVFIWAAAFAISLPPLVFSKVIFMNGRAVCAIHYPDGINQSWDLVFNSMFMLVTYVLPMIALGITYTRIALRLWNQQIIGNLSEAQLSQIEQKRRLVRVLVCVLVSFLVCWFPYQLYFVVSNMWSAVIEVPGIQHVYMCFYWLAMSSSVYNPIIYVILNKKYRRGFQSAWGWLPCVRRPKRSQTGALYADTSVPMSLHMMMPGHHNSSSNSGTHNSHSNATRQSSQNEMTTNISITSTLSSLNIAGAAAAAAASTQQNSNNTTSPIKRRNSPRLPVYNTTTSSKQPPPPSSEKSAAAAAVSDAALFYKIMHSPTATTTTSLLSSEGNGNFSVIDDGAAAANTDNGTATTRLIPPIKQNAILAQEVEQQHGRVWTPRCSMRQPSIIQEEELETLNNMNNNNNNDEDDEDIFND